jgi:hypothetical protein
VVTDALEFVVETVSEASKGMHVGPPPTIFTLSSKATSAAGPDVGGVAEVTPG